MNFAPPLRRFVLVLVVLAVPHGAAAQSPIAYHLSFPAPEHRWMQVDMLLSDLPAARLELRMSRSSPGRYALHEFARNVYDVQITDSAGHALTVVRPTLHAWDVPTHAGTVHVAYKVFGDRVDGTYLGIDATHAHINMPAALMWARGLERRRVTVRFEPPAGASWRVATQLFPSSDPLTFTAPNLQYLMDSPSEFGPIAWRTFTVRDSPRNPTFRVAMHHQGTDAELQAYTRDAETIVRETGRVFGAFPAFDSGTYTFIVDNVPWANNDGMEHRNSTILTSNGSLARMRASLVGVAHEFFHAWNVERIRPQSLEPFNLEDANVSSELWLAEGVTNYYGPLILRRAGLLELDDVLQTLSSVINTVALSPGRRLRTAEEMSRLAPFADGAAALDRTNVENTFISYYTWGEAIGLALDLTLRDRSESTITLDDFMRALWQRFGTSGERVPGYVERPYTASDLRAVLASVAGDEAFAADFFARYVQGHEIADYRRLLARAGLLLRPSQPGAAYAGDLHLRTANGRVRIDGAVPFGSPAYDAGLERDDVITSVAGAPIARVEDFDAALRRQKPGAAIPVVFERRGMKVSSAIRLVEDPRQEIVAAETAGQPLSDAQRRFRAAWLSPERRTF